MITTKYNQTPVQLSYEFIDNMRKMPSGGRDGELLTASILQSEKSAVAPQKVYDQIKNVSGLGFDATTVHLIKNCKLDVSPVLLSFICSQSRAIPDFINSMLGLYAAKFYSLYPQDYQLTMEWVIGQIGHGKIIGHTHFFPYAMACKDAQGRNIFDVITKKDLYTWEQSKASSTKSVS